ncbi:exodeoxyribonuclease V subunit beta [Pantoea sp. 1.19]|uniref:exodeoxyribonuclease V subunit beta n=1 Tax=Pantoea sp. 1.19 TaxID=1925589 RepID=UPI000948CDFA|nr:exodeoxyribonuclease V subunit beta [Pantoea sp. 1.19]
MSASVALPLDPLSLPLTGVRLIEASAGTGKTFTIGLLWLRLLLGLDGESGRRPLGVEEILVVTFTEAATAELRGRIRENIHQLRLACLRGGSDRPELAALLAELPDSARAAQMLLAAERQMDDAAIFTIHGFCQRMLSLNAFESGMLFEQQLLEDESALRRQAAADFWRRHCYPLPQPIAARVAEHWQGPDDLLRTLQPWLQGETPTLKNPPDPDETLEQRHAALIARIDAIKLAWRTAAGEVAALIAASGVDKRSYSARYLPGWIESVSAWAHQPTEDYQLPKALDRFSQAQLEEKTRKGDVPRHALFQQIEAFLAEPLDLRDLLIARALSAIRRLTRQEKRQRAQLGFDDLLSRLDEALAAPGGEALAQRIRQRFPVALIDEFQDTDPQQYRIFRTLYVSQPEVALLLIGDPKQAIYAFRGADIFTYMKARTEVSAHYTMSTNWRSSPAMIAAVNQLFTLPPRPFLFSAITFSPVAPSPARQAFALRLRDEAEPAMRIWLQPGEGVGVSEYQQFMARQCAASIRDWLEAGQRGEAVLDSGSTRRPVSAGDIAVLVRSRREAAHVREALSQRQIPSVYLSSRDSVFATPEARELGWLLQAVLAPEQERSLRSAMATSLFGLDAAALDALNQDERAWDALVDEFSDYRQHWFKRGVLPMLREVMRRRALAESLLATPGGERRLTDLLHLGELLQEASTQLDSEPALLRWLHQQIAQPNWQSASQQLRLESDRHLVQIITIHKAKGLEYPLVWLPFAAAFREADGGLYHDPDSGDAVLDLQQAGESRQRAEQERLAEDLRLLYVALTRSVWHCSIGLAPVFRGNRKKSGDSDLAKSALGWLLGGGNPLSAETLRQALVPLSTAGIAVTECGPTDLQPWQPDLPAAPVLSSAQLTRVLQDDWRVTSYSGLQQHGSGGVFDLLPKLDVDAAGEGRASDALALTPHSFPRGAAPGTFLHGLFETLDFTQPIDPDWLADQLAQQGLDEGWLPVMQEWLSAILQAPLGDSGATLQAVSNADKQAELAFFLPIDGLLTAMALDTLIRRHDPLSAQAGHLQFRQVQGMLKGFIDLVFRWQGKYYLLDYKSNWLGEDASAYTPEAMAAAMVSHRYDLQYQLYSLALHRYLRHRLTDYDYDRHFGGVFYLFLRGADADRPGQGVWQTRPDADFIARLDALFQHGESST